MHHLKVYHPVAVRNAIMVNSKLNNSNSGAYEAKLHAILYELCDELRNLLPFKHQTKNLFLLQVMHVITSSMKLIIYTPVETIRWQTYVKIS